MRIEVLGEVGGVNFAATVEGRILGFVRRGRWVGGRKTVIGVGWVYCIFGDVVLMVDMDIDINGDLEVGGRKLV